MIGTWWSMLKQTNPQPFLNISLPKPWGIKKHFLSRLYQIDGSHGWTCTSALSRSNSHSPHRTEGPSAVGTRPCLYVLHLETDKATEPRRDNLAQKHHPPVQKDHASVVHLGLVTFQITKWTCKLYFISQPCLTKPATGLLASSVRGVGLWKGIFSPPSVPSSAARLLRAPLCEDNSSHLLTWRV